MNDERTVARAEASKLKRPVHLIKRVTWKGRDIDPERGPYGQRDEESRFAEQAKGVRFHVWTFCGLNLQHDEYLEPGDIIGVGRVCRNCMRVFARFLRAATATDADYRRFQAYIRWSGIRGKQL